MSRALPVRIDPYRSAPSGLEYVGAIDLRQFTRLAAILVHADGQVRVEARFETGADRRPRMIGHLQADVALVCQRCLEPVVVEIDAGVDLVFVETEAEAERVEAGTDAMVLANGETIHVVDLLEDELLLQLPLVARHTDAEGCSLRMEPTESASEPVRQADAPEETEQNPFAVLNKLKQ